MLDITWTNVAVAVEKNYVSFAAAGGACIFVLYRTHTAWQADVASGLLYGASIGWSVKKSIPGTLAALGASCLWARVRDGVWSTDTFQRLVLGSTLFWGYPYSLPVAATVVWRLASDN